MCVFGRQIKDFNSGTPEKYKLHTTWRKILEDLERLFVIATSNKVNVGKISLKNRKVLPKKNPVNTLEPKKIH